MTVLTAALLQLATSTVGDRSRAVVMPKVVGNRRCADDGDAAVKHVASLRFTRDEYVAILEVAVAFRRGGLEPFPDSFLCFDPKEERRTIERSAAARHILRRYHMPTDTYVERMWSLMLALTDPAILQHSTDAIRANRDLTADPRIKRLLDMVSRD